MQIDAAAVVLHLFIRVEKQNHEAFYQYVRDAFPVFEQRGDCKGAIYVAGDDPELFDEVFYYESEDAYQAGERAINEDPVQVELLKRWRAMLAGPPRVEVYRRLDRGADHYRTRAR